MHCGQHSTTKPTHGGHQQNIHPKPEESIHRLCPINNNGHPPAFICNIWKDYTIKIEENNRATKKDYDATLSIEYLAEQIESAVTVAGNENQPYTVAQ
eukprot:8070128-Ditylum_brightwellii.AAC.1